MIPARTTTVSTPIEPLLLAVSNAGLCAVSWLDPHPLELTLRHLRDRGFAPQEDDATAEVVLWQEQMAAYFTGDLRQFTGSLDFTGASAFTERALRAILDIPWGVVCTYGEVAASIGMPGATQAIGNAMGRNPLPVVVPCHRVIRANREMGHYTGGPQIKASLLANEGIRFEKHPGQLALF